METRIEHPDFDNKTAGNAETDAHKKIIERNEKEGFSYCGFIPVKMGPSGKMLAIDPVFQKSADSRVAE